MSQSLVGTLCFTHPCVMWSPISKSESTGKINPWGLLASKFLKINFKKVFVTKRYTPKISLGGVH
jgi:hypothetical protein